MLNSITQPFEGVIQSLDKDGYVKDEIVVIEGETQSRSAPAQCTFSFDLVWRCNFGANHPPGYPNCHGGSVVIGYNVRWTCTSGPGGGGSNNPDPDPNPGSGGSGGSGDGGDDECYDCLPTEPIPGDEECTTSLCTLDTVLEPNALEAGTRLWMSSQYRQALLSDVLDFIIYENDNSDESKLFSIEGMEAERNSGEVDYEEKVIVDDSFKDNQCLMNVYEAMGKAPIFDNYLQNFDSDMSVANLKFGADPNFASNRDQKYHNAMAITNPPLNSNMINIDFNTDPSTSGNILNKPDVFKAVSLIHEVLHAEMCRKMLDAVRAAEKIKPL
ncbi:hypothetical protein [Psychroflexus gondwanensis]|uniref:hypothetical protein n=1 Tax=Psychroflexus gondwanensis TaxID=251 RepID=UPI0011BE42CE|nr:hypothetical protein [Psychroflexus gondwanensis]